MVSHCSAVPSRGLGAPRVGEAGAPRQLELAVYLSTGERGGSCTGELQLIRVCM